MKYSTLTLCLFIYIPLNAIATRIDIRSQSENLALDSAGLAPHIHVPLNGYHGTIAISTGYSRTFDSAKITHALFGCDAFKGKTITIKGSTVSNRNNRRDWVAENFYLSNNFSSELSLKPRIEQSITDVNLFMGFNNVLDGLFVRIHAPIVWTKWNLSMQETILTKGTTAGWLGITPFDTINASKLLGSFTEYACQELVPNETYSTTADQIHTAYPLTVAKLCFCPIKKTGLSDIQADIGWDYMRNDYHIGFFGRLVIPTGTRPDGEYLFEPVIGNGGHWEFGGGITSHAHLWKNEPRKRSLDIQINANITHLFNAAQQRVFDLKGFGDLSRYLLVEKINTPVETINVSPAANLTHRTVNVSATIQTDMVIMFSYLRKFLSCDFGYNFWARTREKFNSIPCCNNATSDAEDGDRSIIDNPSNKYRSACNRAARSCSDRSCPAGDCSLGLATELDNREWRAVHGNATLRTLGTNSPVVLKESTIDYDSARTRGISHKLFTNIAYNWLDNGTWVPYIGAGAEIELGQHGDDTPLYRSHDVALSQWSAWVKGGVSF